MDEHEVEVGTMTAPGPSWQRWSLFFARTGYSDLELSAFMTAQGIHRARVKAEAAAPPVYLAAERLFADEQPVALPLTLAAAAD
jgi:hypothetical protein